MIKKICQNNLQYNIQTWSQQHYLTVDLTVNNDIGMSLDSTLQQPLPWPSFASCARLNISAEVLPFSRLSLRSSWVMSQMAGRHRDRMMNQYCRGGASLKQSDTILYANVSMDKIVSENINIIQHIMQIKYTQVTLQAVLWRHPPVRNHTVAVDVNLPMVPQRSLWRRWFHPIPFKLLYRRMGVNKTYERGMGLFTFICLISFKI